LPSYSVHELSTHIWPAGGVDVSPAWGVNVWPAGGVVVCPAGGVVVCPTGGVVVRLIVGASDVVVGGGLSNITVVQILE
jgi:hypothetical protein